jgi:hypothetical protein
VKQQQPGEEVSVKAEAKEGNTPIAVEKPDTLAQLSWKSI